MLELYIIPVRSNKEIKGTFTRQDQNNIQSVTHKGWQDGREQLKKKSRELESINHKHNRSKPNYLSFTID